jgi:tetratricopeptide (TPR) repeat protein
VDLGCEAGVSTPDGLRTVPEIDHQHSIFHPTNSRPNPDASKLTLYSKVNATKIQQMLKRMWQRLWRTSKRNPQNLLPISPEPIPNLSAQISPQPDSVIAVDNEGAETWFDRGYEQFEAGRDDEAVASFDQAVTIQPDDHEAWYSATRIHL